MELNDIAARITAPLPERIAFIGDSLTAMNRDRNYCAQVGAALAERFGDAVEVINAGVGGDTIERCEDRLDEVLAKKPDGAFVFVGHNDSKITWHPDTETYVHCIVPTDRFEASFRRTIEKLRAGGVTWLTLISPSASCEAKTRATHERKMAERVRHNFFGRPDLLEEYLGIVQRLAAETGCGFLDVYHPMRESDDCCALTDEGGVHLSEAGDRFIAECVLDYLAGDQAGARGGTS